MRYYEPYCRPIGFINCLVTFLSENYSVRKNIKSLLKSALTQSRLIIIHTPQYIITSCRDSKTSVGTLMISSTPRGLKGKTIWHF